MTKGKVIQGSCLCGGVTIAIQSTEEVFDVCHCGMCRRWGGGPAFTLDGGKNFEIKGQELISTFSSSAWAERSFCKQCGTHLFYRLKEANFHNFSFGLFHETSGFEFRSQIFIDSKVPNYDFANSTEKLTEAEVLAKYS